MTILYIYYNILLLLLLIKTRTYRFKKPETLLVPKSFSKVNNLIFLERWNNLNQHHLFTYNPQTHLKKIPLRPLYMSSCGIIEVSRNVLFVDLVKC